MTALACVLSELETPDAVVTMMENTTAMQGVQQASHRALDYRWTCHPDNGLELIITESQAAGG